ncbi:tyrosine kinase receptor Cad96Ca-like [Ptychodera flava]|uniref:tyrosine kinase receptor Cad96Ca-like n=1 Tax=Ptychodera flava TaxID=63121 RepID=UPI00396A9C5F
MVCKISNFGYSTDVIGNTQFFELTNQFEISYQWMALESLLQRTFTTKSDVWSYGIALWEIFTLGQRPYFKDTQSEVLTKLNKGYRLLKPGYCEEELYRLMLACWKTKQESRPSFAEIISSISQVSKIIPVQRASHERDDKVSGKIRRPSLQRQFRVDHYIVRVTREVFRGKFSQIYLGKARMIDDESDSVQNVAVKVFTDVSTEVSSLQREVDLMKSIPSHENVIGLLAYCTDEAPPFFVMEFARHGNLQRHLVENRPRFLTGDGMSSQRHIFSFAKDIACGMEHLSNIGITHRYLTAKHVLVFTNTICKISSLGYVSDVTHGKRLLDMAKEVRHPYQWMALETLTNWTFNTYTDVWSFGVVLWEIITLGKKPFEGFEQHEVLARLRKGYRLLKPSHCSDEVYDTMLSCWRKESNERPSFSKLVDVIKDHRERTDKLVDFTEYK